MSSRRNCGALRWSNTDSQPATIAGLPSWPKGHARLCIPGLKVATQNISAQPKGGTYPPFCRDLHWSYTGLLPADFSRVAVFGPLYDAGMVCSRSGLALHRKRSTLIAGGQFHLMRGIALVARAHSQLCHCHLDTQPPCWDVQSQLPGWVCHHCCSPYQPDVGAPYHQGASSYTAGCWCCEA